MTQWKCYVQEYQTGRGLTTLLREKETNKKISIQTPSLEDKLHFLRFLSEAKANENAMPTIFDRAGDDMVVVCGVKQKEETRAIFVNTDVDGGGYWFKLGAGNIGYHNVGKKNNGDGNTGDENNGIGNIGWGNVGNCNTGAHNKGDENIGNDNVGDGNIGDRNHGDGNDGDNNNGDFNQGANNDGDCNQGDENDGDKNVGDCNVGDGNIGCHNVGDGNTGDCNVGRENIGNRNIGNRNIGEFNCANFAVGCFNTTPQPLFFFNKPSNWTTEQWLKSEARRKLRFLLDPPLEWLDRDSMTELEEQEHPAHTTTNGYPKVTPRAEWLAQNVYNWSQLSEKDKRVVMSTPNFDKEIFKQITGIDVDAEPQ